MAKNPARYRALCEPHPDAAAANAAIQKFFDLVEAARTECHIPDVTCILNVRCIENSEEIELASSAHFGDSLRELPMLANAYGRAKEAQESLLARLTTERRKGAR